MHALMTSLYPSLFHLLVSNLIRTTMHHTQNLLFHSHTYIELASVAVAIGVAQKRIESE